MNELKRVESGDDADLNQDQGEGSSSVATKPRVWRLLEKKARGILRDLGESLNSPLLRALSWRLETRVMSGEGGRYRILSQTRKIGNDDLVEIGLADQGLEIRILPSFCLATVSKKTLETDPEWDDFTGREYHQRESNVPYREPYAAIIDSVLKWWWRFGWRFDAVVSSNFGYRREQELFRLGKKYGFKVIVLYKEGMAIPGRWKEMAVTNRGKCFWDYGLFSNESIRKAVIDVAFPDKMESSWAVGIPRLDACFRIPPPPDRRHITFFSFFPADKFGYLGGGSELIDKAIERSEAFHRMVMRGAAEFEDIQFTIKTKKAQRYLDHVLEIKRSVEEELGGPIKNVTITNKEDPRELIGRSCAVIGFASTTLIEALAAGREVICPYFGDLFEQSWCYFESYPDLVYHVKEGGDLSGAIGSISKGESCRNRAENGRDDFLEGMVVSSDGDAGRRAAERIRAIIDASGGAFQYPRRDVPEPGGAASD